MIFPSQRSELAFPILLETRNAVSYMWYMQEEIAWQLIEVFKSLTTCRLPSLICQLSRLLRHDSLVTTVQLLIENVSIVKHANLEKLIMPCFQIIYSLTEQKQQWTNNLVHIIFARCWHLQNSAQPQLTSARSIDTSAFKIIASRM